LVVLHGMSNGPMNRFNLKYSLSLLVMSIVTVVVYERGTPFNTAVDIPAGEFSRFRFTFPILKAKEL
jgi:hypothetical protein